MAYHFARNSLILLLLCSLAASDIGRIWRVVDGANHRRVHVTDDLHDVVDDEEDEAWREWGKKSTKPPDFDPSKGMDQFQNPLQSGPAFGFVKLRLGSPRTREMISEIAKKWSNLARTGAIEAKFMGVDSITIMFTMERGQDLSELKDFILNQPDAYEMKVGDQLIRRPGDPPFEDVYDELQRAKSEADRDTSSVQNERHHEL